MTGAGAPIGMHVCEPRLGREALARFGAHLAGRTFGIGGQPVILDGPNLYHPALRSQGFGHDAIGR